MQPNKTHFWQHFDPGWDHLQGENFIFSVLFLHGIIALSRVDAASSKKSKQPQYKQQNNIEDADLNSISILINDF